MDLLDEIIVALYSIERQVSPSDLCAIIYIAERLLGERTIDIYEMTCMGPSSPNFNFCLYILNQGAMVEIKDGIMYLTDRGKAMARKIITESNNDTMLSLYRLTRELGEMTSNKIIELCEALWRDEKQGGRIADNIRHLLETILYKEMANQKQSIKTPTI